MSETAPRLADWVGNSVVRHETVERGPAARMAALFDWPAAPGDGDPLPPLWHWLYFLEVARQSDLGRDGHPALGGFLPPVPLPRRMWAGGRLRFAATLRIGERAEKTSTVTDVVEKSGRSGALVFVTVEHVVRGPAGEAVREAHDIVYREPPRPGAPAPAPQPAPGDAAWSARHVMDPVALFRYSALTFNGHRIHYDADFCRDREGYPGLIVHGPLLATCLVALVGAQAPDRTLQAFDFRALATVYADRPFTANAAPADDGTLRLWIADGDGALAMEATARLT